MVQGTEADSRAGHERLPVGLTATATALVSTADSDFCQFGFTETTAPTCNRLADYATNVSAPVHDIRVGAAISLNVAGTLPAPSTSCEILGRLRPGDQIQPTAQTEGENINGFIALWVEFVNSKKNGRPPTLHVSEQWYAEQPVRRRAGRQSSQVQFVVCISFIKLARHVGAILCRSPASN